VEAPLDDLDVRLLRERLSKLIDCWTRTHGRAEVAHLRARWWIAPAQDAGREFLAAMSEHYRGDEAAVLAEVGRAAQVLAILAVLAQVPPER